MMQSTPLVDLSPALYLMLLAACLALLLSAWLWFRHRNASWPRRLRALVWLTLFLTFDLVLFGAFTRLTDSGLGCPDWPGCYASASPLGAHLAISAEQSAMPHGPVTHQKAWIEMAHRYGASVIGALITLMAALCWWQRQALRQALGLSPWWASFTLLWVCLQGAFGALTVTMRLFPAIVTLHLLAGIALLALLRMLAARCEPAERAPALAPQVRRWLVAGFALLWLQIALGGWVSTNYAVLACNEFPMCQGQWVPSMAFGEGFAIWRELGQTTAGTTISLPALTAIHVVHRMFAFVVFGVLGFAAWRLWRSASDGAVAAKHVQRGALWIAALLLWQLLTGLSNVVLGWPLLAAVSHTGGAAGLVVVLTGLLYGARAPASSAVQPQGMLAAMSSPADTAHSATFTAPASPHSRGASA
jgi:heme a synthase